MVARPLAHHLLTAHPATPPSHGATAPLLRRWQQPHPKAPALSRLVTPQRVAVRIAWCYPQLHAISRDELQRLLRHRRLGPLPLDQPSRPTVHLAPRRR